MEGEIEKIVRSAAGANTDREPSRLAACGASPPVDNVRTLPATRMPRPGTGRGPTEKSAQAGDGRNSAIGNRQL
jgi:hypothetical protein